MEVLWHPEAAAELDHLATKDRVALLNAIGKLEALGVSLGYPHTSSVRGVKDLRELRPRAGRSALRVFYRRVGGAFVIGAIGPEARSDRIGFKSAIQVAQGRLDSIEEV